MSPNFDDLAAALRASGEPYHPPDLPYISLIKLLANPEAYDRKVVQVDGFLNLEFEGDALYLHHEDWEQMLTKNALWLNVPREIWERKYELTERYAIVTGTFLSGSHGHMNLFGGAITEIQDIRPKCSREEAEEIRQRAHEKIEREHGNL